MRIPCLYNDDRGWGVALHGDASRHEIHAGPASEAPASIGSRARQICEEAGADPAKIVLGLPTSWCLWGVVPSKAPGGRRGMSYQLEEQLPLSVEETTADFAIGPEDAFGCAVRSGELREWTAALRANGWNEIIAVPTSLALA